MNKIQAYFQEVKSELREDHLIYRIDRDIQTENSFAYIIRTTDLQHDVL